MPVLRVAAFSTKIAASCQSIAVRSTALTPLFFMLMTSVVKSDCSGLTSST